MKFTIIFTVWAAWAAVAALWWMDHQGTIQQPFWVITSPLWGTVLLFTAAYAWADYKAKRNAKNG